MVYTEVFKKKEINMEEILNQIANLGFPIVLSIYLLVRLEGKMENLSESITKLSASVDAIGRRAND